MHKLSLCFTRRTAWAVYRTHDAVYSPSYGQIVGNFG